MARGSGSASAKPGILRRIKDLRSVDTSPRGANLEIVSAATRQLGTLLGAGIPLIEALRALIEQSQNRRAETIFRAEP